VNDFLKVDTDIAADYFKGSKNLFKETLRFFIISVKDLAFINQS